MTSSKHLDKKIKVLIGTNDLLLAGVQRLVIDQLVNLDRTRFEPSLVVLMQFPGREDFYDLVPKDVVVYKLSFSGLLDFKEWRALMKILREVKPDVVKTAMFFSNSIFLILRPFFGYRVVAAEHNTVNAKPLWQRIVDRLLLPSAHTVIGDSKMVTDFVSRAEGINKKHFTVVYNGIDLDAVAHAEQLYGPQRSAIRAEFSIPTDAHVVFTAARLVKQKNHTLMIEGFSRLRGRSKNAYLVIAGEGTLRPELEKLATDLGVSDRVIFLGARKDIQRFYAIADTFILTSVHEGFCVAAMEGLAFGLPLLSTKVAGVIEYLREGENGFFVANDADDIAAYILRVVEFSEEERARFKAAAKKTAEAYSVKRYAETINRIFEEAAN